jgi:acid phosphatase (class A)
MFREESRCAKNTPKLFQGGITMAGRALKIFLTLALLTAVMSCGSFQAQDKTAVMPELQPGSLGGYLNPDALPNSLALLPPPPAQDSPDFALDLEVSRKSFALRGTPRWALAIEDANLASPEAADAFSCALGSPITKQQTPHLYTLLHRTLVDAVLSTHAAKNHYKRTRPFMMNGEPICTPNDENKLRKEGSYPSGHTAIGWAWALILSEIAPQQGDEIIDRGRAFGESRIICNVHWHSDVAEGRYMGSATVARLHADPAFRTALEAAKAELAAVRAKGLKPRRDCRKEARALLHSIRIP